MKTLITSILLFVSLSVFAQDEISISKRSEVKVNALYVVLGGIEVDYEYILNEESSVGLSVAKIFDEDVFDYGWSVTPHYRLFFGKQPAVGFFVEGNASIFEYNDYSVVFDGTSSMVIDDKEILGGLGIAVGGKFKTTRNVVVEAFAGLGRVFGSDGIGVYPRLGINIGKRF